MMKKEQGFYYITQKYKTIYLIILFLNDFYMRSILAASWNMDSDAPPGTAAVPVQRGSTLTSLNCPKKRILIIRTSEDGKASLLITDLWKTVLETTYFNLGGTVIYVVANNSMNAFSFDTGKVSTSSHACSRTSSLVAFSTTVFLIAADCSLIFISTSC